MTSTPSKYKSPQISNPLDHQSSSPRRNFKTLLEHVEEKMKFSAVDTASQSFLLNYIKSKFCTPQENLRLRGGVGGYPNRLRIIINIPPIGANQNQQEGAARGLNLGLFKQGTDLIKSVKDEKALMEDAYGTAKEMFHDGIPKFNTDTMNQGYHLLENVKQQKDKIHDVVGNAQQISDSLGIDIKGDPREAVEKLKKGYEAYSAVKKLQSEPFNAAGNLLATGGALFKNLGVGSRSAHISDLPLQGGGNVSCPPCPSRRGVRMRSANIPETDMQQETLDRPNFGNLKRLLEDLNFKIDMEMKKCMHAYKKYEENPNMSPEEMSELKIKLKCCRYKYSFIEGHISRLLANLN